MNAPGRRSAPLLEWLGAMLVSALLLLASDLLVPPAATPFPGHGERFAAMAPAPWSLSGAFPQRILWPLGAHVAGWFDVDPTGFSQLVNAALLAVVCWFSRRRGAAWIDATLVTAAVAASGTVLVYKPMACLSDPLTFLLLFLAVHHERRRGLFWGLVLLNALNHELVFFFAPWLFWRRLRAGGDARGDGVALLTIAGVYAAFRLCIGLVGHGTYDAGYYFANNFWVPWGLPAMWGLWAFLVLVEFGPLLIVVVAAARRGEHGMGGRLGPWLYLAAVLPLMLLAYDVMRFANFACVPLVFASLAFLRGPRQRRAFGVLLGSAIVCYSLLHPVASQQGGAVFTRLTGEILSLLPGRVQPGQPMAFGDAMAFTQELLGRTWPTALTTVAAALGIGALGRWLARYWPGPANGAGGAPATMQKASP